MCEWGSFCCAYLVGTLWQFCILIRASKQAQSLLKMRKGTVSRIYFQSPEVLVVSPSVDTFSHFNSCKYRWQPMRGSCPVAGAS